FARARAVAQARKSGRFHVGMIGHLAPIKGPEDFIRAAAIICAQRDDVDFVIAGEDKSRSGRYRKSLESQLHDFKLTGRLQLVGWVDDIAELLTTLDLFVSPALQESFGLAIVEAMAAGVPVVATKSEGALEILDGNQTGTLVEIGDVGALASSINALLNNRDQ